MPPPQSLRTDYDASKPHAVMGEVLNRQNSAIMGNQMGQGGGDGGGRWGGYQAQTIENPTIIGVAVITDASDTCEIDEDDGTVKAPCSSLHKYRARFRTFNHDNRIWSEYDDEYNLDASGFWEGLTEGEPAETPQTYATNASRSPSSGIGFGHIPTFQNGDTLVCFFDEQRGELIPIPGVHEDEISGEFLSQQVEGVGLDDESGLSNYVEFILEVNTADTTTWVPVSTVAFRLPGNQNDSGPDGWFDTRSGFATFSANISAAKGAFVRIRGVSTVDYGVNVSRKQIQFIAAGRQGASSTPGITQINALLGGGILNEGWGIVAGTAGRWADSPSFTHIGNGIFQINYADTLDGWIIRAHFAIEISTEPTSSSSSTSTTTSSSSSSSTSSSTTPTSTSSSTPTSSSTTPTSSSSTPTSTSSTPTSTSSPTTTSTPTSTISDFECIQVVVDVRCEDNEIVIEKCEICFPTSLGVEINCDF